MRIEVLTQARRGPREEGSILGYLLIVLILMAGIASVAAFVIQHVQFAQRRLDRINAMEFAEGASLIGCREVEKALTNGGTGFTANLEANSAGGYAKNSSLSTSSLSVYERTVTAPFSNQTAKVQLWMTNATAPTELRVVSSATVGKVTQTATAYLQMQFAYGAAIISDSPGSTSHGVSKSVAQQGNVVLDGGSSSPVVVDGGVLANGRVNVGSGATVPTDSISMTNYNTENEIPDYTDDGSADQLFDFNRFIAVANASGNHYTNLSSFITAANAGTLEGVIVVDIDKSESKLGDKDVPGGINVRGTLVFNFTGGWSATDKLVNTAAININAADLTGLNPSDPTTFTTGYPPTYVNPAKNPFIVTPVGYPQFSTSDDLPALMYNIGILDIHGPANICGVVYSPSFMEIENKDSGQIQYFKGSLIGGGGILVDNGQKGAKSVVSYDPNALDRLATSGTKGKSVVAAYRQ